MNKGIDAGSMDRRIQILRATDAADAYNEKVQAWPVFMTIWASKTPVSDGERLRAGEIGAHEMARFVIRHSLSAKTITPRDRIGFEGKQWEISGVKTVGRGVGFEITAHARPDLLP